MTETEKLRELKQQIAEIFQQREELKQAIEDGTLSAREGFKRLEPIDIKLSELDLMFKTLWDAQNG